MSANTVSATWYLLTASFNGDSASFPAGAGGAPAVVSCTKISTLVSMLDCPEPTHTSPTSTSVTVMVLVPATVSVAASPTLTGSSLTIHFPWASAAVDFSWSRNRTVTFSPGLAVPQMGTGTSRWRTMWLLMTGGSLTSASAVAPMQVSRTHRPALRRHPGFIQGCNLAWCVIAFCCVVTILFAN